MWITFPIFWLSFAGYGYWIAKIKRRPPGEGILYGLLLGPIGCIIESTLRERTVEEVEEEKSHREEELQARLEAERQHQAAIEAETARVRREAQERSELARARRAELYVNLSDWFDRTILKFGWYKALPEVAQPIVIGLLVALPLVILMAVLFRGGTR